VVHAGDLDRAVTQALDRVVGAAVALEHLGRLPANREREELVAEANAEQRQLRLQQLTDDGDGIFAGRGGVAGAVGEEDAVGLECHHLIEGCSRGEDRDARAGGGEVAVDVAFGAVIDRDDMGLLKPLPFRGGVGVGRVRLTETGGDGESPHPNPSPEGEGL